MENPIREQARRLLARRRHRDYIAHCWYRQEAFVVGRHTEAICARLDKAFSDFCAGKSTFLYITCPPRHGKTDMVSRYLPAHFLGEFPENEVLVATYAQELANKISRDARLIYAGERHVELYPGSALSQESFSVQTWKCSNEVGGTQWAGAGAGVTGSGYHLGVLDDPIKDRMEAESEVVRSSRWEWFMDVFLTRRAPVSITIVMMTRWHVDDIIGRIQRMNDKAGEEYNVDFPMFEALEFPAESAAGFLFPERFPPEWYNSYKVNPYSWASLFMCRPVVRGGNLFAIEKVKVEAAAPDGLKWVRAWDLASTEKETAKDDPDWTAGALVGIRQIKNEAGQSVDEVWLKHVARFQGKAPDRDKYIRSAISVDGAGITQYIEAVGGYKDTYNNIKAFVDGKATVRSIEDVHKDKVERSEALQVVVEAGNFHVVRGEWNQAFLDELAAFPSGRHDDQVDAVVHAYNARARGPSFADLPKITAGKRPGNE